MVQFGIEPGTSSHPASGPAAERQSVSGAAALSLNLEI
jgi:hypothetical protein